MKVEIWSDIVCPWCYIGRRRFQSALATFEHADQVEVVWRSFELDPGAPRGETVDVAEHLGRRYGGGREAGLQMLERVTEVAAGEGLDYHLDRARRTNTVDAHRVLHLAAEHGLQDALKERLLRAYFTEGLDVGDHGTLVDLAAEVGLPADETRAMLGSDRLIDAVRADEAEGSALGIQGVPFFVVDRRYGVSGAQPADFLLQVLQRAWEESQPLQMVPAAGADDGNACDGDACAI